MVNQVSLELPHTHTRRTHTHTHTHTVPSEQPVQDAHEQEPTGNDIIPAGNDITPGVITTDGATMSVTSSEKTEVQGVTEGEGGGSHAEQEGEEGGGKMEEDNPADVTEGTTTDSRSNQALVCPNTHQVEIRRYTTRSASTLDSLTCGFLARKHVCDSF